MGPPSLSKPSSSRITANTHHLRYDKTRTCRHRPLQSPTLQKHSSVDHNAPYKHSALSTHLRLNVWQFGMERIVYLTCGCMPVRRAKRIGV